MTVSFNLTKHVFLSSVAASTAGTWYPVDWRYSGIQQRSIIGTKAASASDVINIELNIIVTAADNSLLTVITTATSFAGAVTNFSAVIQGPFDQIRVRKEGSSAAATVVGMI